MYGGSRDRFVSRHASRGFRIRFGTHRIMDIVWKTERMDCSGYKFDVSRVLFCTFQTILRVLSGFGSSKRSSSNLQITKQEICTRNDVQVRTRHGHVAFRLCTWKNETYLYSALGQQRFQKSSKRSSDRSRRWQRRASRRFAMELASGSSIRLCLDFDSCRGWIWYLCIVEIELGIFRVCDSGK